MDLTTKRFWDLELVDETPERWLAYLSWHLGRARAPLRLVMTPNPEQLVLARRARDFHACLRQADILLPDGDGLVWAGGLSARLTGADTSVALLRLARARRLKILLVGGRYGARADHRLTIEFDGEPSMIFYTPGYQNIALPTPAEQNQLELLISDLHPDVVLVAFGAPAQERWLVAQRELLERSGVKLALAVGGSFDFLTGRLRRAPLAWQRWHLEWLYRLLQEPGRWRRQLALPLFVWLKITGFWQPVQSLPKTGEKQ